MPQRWSSLLFKDNKENGVLLHQGLDNIYSRLYLLTPSLLQQIRLTQLHNGFAQFQIDLAYHANDSGFVARDGATDLPIPRNAQEYIDMAASIINRCVVIDVQDLIDRLSGINRLVHRIRSETTGGGTVTVITSAMDASAVMRLLQAAQERVHRLLRAEIKFEHLSGSAPA